MKSDVKPMWVVRIENKDGDTKSQFETDDKSEALQKFDELVAQNYMYVNVLFNWDGCIYQSYKTNY